MLLVRWRTCWLGVGGDVALYVFSVLQCKDPAERNVWFLQSAALNRTTAAWRSNCMGNKRFYISKHNCYKPKVLFMIMFFFYFNSKLVMICTVFLIYDIRSVTQSDETWFYEALRWVSAHCLAATSLLHGCFLWRAPESQCARPAQQTDS